MVSNTYIRFERHSYEDGYRELEEQLVLGPFDWVEVEGGTMNAEAEDGNVRHDPLAILEPEPHNWHWQIEGREGKWQYFVVFSHDGEDPPSG